VARIAFSTAGVQVKAQEEIYLGKGRFIKDDPKKYPSKDEWTGGWAGGETGLWSFRDEIKVRQASLLAQKDLH
jgi:hypothetical protein